MLRGLITRDLGVLRVRGRRVKPIWTIGGGRVRRARTKLLRSLPQILAFVQRPQARTAVRVPGDPGACASTGRTERASFDGFDMSIAGNGDVSMNVSVSGGYAIQVFIGGALRCSDLDLPACPTAAGRLDGTDGRRSALGLRVTQNGRLVQSVRTTVRSTQRLAGEVADDAKLERMSIEDVATETTAVQVPGATGTITLSVRRTVVLGRGGAFVQAPRVQVGFGVRGLPRRGRRGGGEPGAGVLRAELRRAHQRRTGGVHPPRGGLADPGPLREGHLLPGDRLVHRPAGRDGHHHTDGGVQRGRRRRGARSGRCRARSTAPSRPTALPGRRRRSSTGSPASTSSG